MAINKLRDKLIDLAGIANLLEIRCIENTSQARYLKVKLDHILSLVDEQMIKELRGEYEILLDCNQVKRAKPTMILSERYYDETE